MVDFAKRSPGLWIGLGFAVLAIVVCLGALAVLAVLAGFRGGLFARTTSSAGATPQSATLAAPLSPLAKATALPPPVSNWPLANVPMPAETELGTLVGPPEAFSVFADQDFDEVLAFYQSEMDALGWTKVSYGTRITANDAELQYKNDIYHATVILARIPFIGTLVEIRLRVL